jgi:hypothetical protein
VLNRAVLRRRRRRRRRGVIVFCHHWHDSLWTHEKDLGTAVRLGLATHRLPVHGGLHLGRPDEVHDWVELSRNEREPEPPSFCTSILAASRAKS